MMRLKWFWFLEWSRRRLGLVLDMRKTRPRNGWPDLGSSHEQQASSLDLYLYDTRRTKTKQTYKTNKMDERARDGQNPGPRNERSLDQLNLNAHAAAAAKKIRIDLSASLAAHCMYECNGNFSGYIGLQTASKSVLLALPLRDQYSV